jgi:hypothetical protein
MSLQEAMPSTGRRAGLLSTLLRRLTAPKQSRAKRSIYLRGKAPKMKLGNLYVWVGVLVGLLAFIPFESLPVSWQTIYEIEDALCCAAFLGVMVACAKTTFDTMRLPFRDVTVEKVFVSFMFFLVTGAFLVFANLWAWRVLHTPLWFTETHFWSFSRWLCIIGGAGVMTIHWKAQGVVSEGAVGKTGAILAAAVGLALVVIGFFN